MTNQIVISRIQNRRGIKENLPQPLLPGEFALTVDTGELWIGTDPAQPPWGVRTYGTGGGDISSAETIVDTQIISVKFTSTLSQSSFDSLVTYLIGSPTPAVDLDDTDILWDEILTVFIAADTSVDVANTIANMKLAILTSPVSATYDAENTSALGALNTPFIVSDAATLTFADANPDTITRAGGSSDFVTEGFVAGQEIYITDSVSNDGTFTIAAGGVAATIITLVGGDSLIVEGPVAATITGETDPTTTTAFDVVDGDFLFTIAGSNAAQGANAASLINKIHGAQLVTTLSNLQVTTSGIGVGSSTFRDMRVTDSDVGFTWSETGTASADSIVDELTFVSGTNIDIDIDTTLDAIRITSTTEADPDILYSGSGVPTEFTLTASTSSFTDVGLNFNLETSEISDVIFIEYSANIAGATPGSNNYTVAGTLMVVGNINVNSGEASLNDTRVEVRDTGLTGAINFQAVYLAGSPDVIKLQYTNTFTTNIAMRILRRRWASF